MGGFCKKCGIALDKNNMYCSKSCASQNKRNRVKPAWNKGLTKKDNKNLKGNTKLRTIETKQKISESKKGCIGTFSGNQHSDESKQKISESKKGCIGTFSGNLHSDESKQKISNKLKQFYSTEHGKYKASEIAKTRATKYWKLVRKNGSQEILHGNEWVKKRKESIQMAQSKRTDNIRISKNEMNVKKFIETLNIDFVHNEYIYGILCRPDFYFKKLNKIIEYNGCYWHVHECMFPHGYTGKDKRIYDNINRDKVKKEFYINNNISLLEIWECEWLNDNENQKQKIKKFLEL